MNWVGDTAFACPAAIDWNPHRWTTVKFVQPAVPFFYPPVSPAVIVAVEREGKILLARNASFPPKRYSVIAGFRTSGESFEDAVRLKSGRKSP